MSKRNCGKILKFKEFGKRRVLDGFRWFFDGFRWLFDGLDGFCIFHSCSPPVSQTKIKALQEFRTVRPPSAMAFARAGGAIEAL